MIKAVLNMYNYNYFLKHSLFYEISHVYQQFIKLKVKVKLRFSYLVPG